MDITVISVSAPALYQLSEFQDMFHEKYAEESLDMHLYYIADEVLSQAVITDKMLNDMQSADMLIVDISSILTTAGQDRTRAILRTFISDRCIHFLSGCYRR